MRVLLVMPTPFENGRLGLENVVWLSEPVALTSVGSAIQDQHEVRVLDLRLEEEDALVRMLSSWKPDVVDKRAAVIVATKDLGARLRACGFSDVSVLLP